MSMMNLRRLGLPSARSASLPLLAAAAIAVGAAVPAAVALPAAAAQPSTGPTQPGKIDLRPKFRRGQQTRYTMTIDSVTDVKSPQLPELDQKQEIRQQIDLLMRVVEAGTDGATIELVYERVRVSFESDAFSAEYDSARAPRSKPPAKGNPKNPKSPPGNAEPGDSPLPGDPTNILNMTDDEFFAQAMQGIAGTVLTIELDASGNILSVHGAGSLVPGGGIPAIGGPAGGAWIVSSPGQSGFASVGETWSTTSTLGNTPLGNFKMVTNYTLRSAAGGKAVIGISGGIEAGSAADKPGHGGAAQIRDSKYSGTCTWDLGSGQLRELRTSQSATIEGASMGVPMTMRSSTDMTVRRAN